MIGEKLTAAINDQITKEFYSAYLYQQMAAWFENEDLPGFANWMRVQAQEESSHALIFFNYVCEQGGKVILGAIDQPPHEYKTPLEVFEKVLEHEQLVTASINNLMDIAIEEKDHASRSRLTWFIDEQVEEEANASALIAKMKRIRDDSPGILMMDKELAARVFVTPSPLAAGE